uniref:Pseudouridine synthase RsuA/RluA-like domain-containing protein n=1 Tax=Trichobilharzia regenti TaxID=157069 RepID=A0AA85KDB0_TRIRE|nr:unnamed protein product [Trichobilharzia regenti]
MPLIKIAITVKIYLLRLYVLLVWNILILYQILRRRRECWIHISDLRIIHENNGFLVINKHPELLINCTSPWINCLTLQMQLFYNRPQYANWKLKNMFHFVHRLDCPTSGLICIAYDTKTASIIRRAFEKKEVKKYYLAILWGHVDSPQCIDSSNTLSPFVKRESKFVYHIQMSLGSLRYFWPDTGRKQKIIVPATHPECCRPRESSTTVIILDYGNLMGEPATRVLLIPNTGRRHQLRVHCAVGLGHPIAGDITYSRRPFNHIDVEYKHDVYRTHNIHLDYKLKRMMLHAYYMEMKLRMNDDSNDNKCRKRLSVEKNYQFQTGENPFFDANDSYLWIEEENLLSQTTSYTLDEYIKNVNFFTS